MSFLVQSFVSFLAQSIVVTVLICHSKLHIVLSVLRTVTYARGAGKAVISLENIQIRRYAQDGVRRFFLPTPIFFICVSVLYNCDFFVK
jgi:hypothetical protein